MRLSDNLNLYGTFFMLPRYICTVSIFSIVFFLCSFLIINTALSLEETLKPEFNVSLTEEEKNWLKSHPNITLGYTDIFEPQVISKPDGSFEGILVDFLGEINQRLGTRIKLGIFPVPELLDRARTKKVDGIVNILPDYSKKLGMLATREHIANYPAVFTRKNTVFNHPSDLAQEKVAIVDKVYFAEQLVKQHGIGATVTKVKNPLEGFQLLQKKEVDFFIAATINTYHLTKYSLLDLTTQYIFHKDPVGHAIAVRSDWPMLVSILNKGIASFSKNEFQAFVTKWVGSFIDQMPQQKNAVVLTPEEQSWLESNPDITFGFTDVFEPAVIVNKDGSYRGTLVDFLDLLNQRLGTDFKIKIKPIPVAFRQVSQKEMAGILALHPDNADKRGFLKTKSYTTSYPTIFARKGASFNAPSDLKGKKIALIDKVFLSQNLVDLYGHGSTLIKVKTAREGLERVKKGTADIFIGSSRNSYLLGKYQFFDLAAVFVFFDHPSLNVMGVRSDWPQLVTILNKGLSTISIEEAESIERKWISVPEQSITFELTEEEQDWLKANSSIKVGLFPLPPYTFVKNGQNQGYLVDMMQLLAGQAGVTPNFSMQVLPETFAQVKNGQLHAVLGIMRNEERADYMYFSENVLKLQMGIFARASRSDIRDAASLKNKIIATRKGYGFENVVKKYLPDAKIIRADDAEGMLQLVATGEADATIRELHSGEFILHNSFINNVIVKGFFTPPGLPATTGAEFAVSKKFPVLNSILNKANNAIPESEKTKVWQKWFSRVESQEKTIELTPEERSWLIRNQTVTVRIIDYPPYMVVKDNAPLQGIVIEYLKLIRERTGVRFDYEVTDQPFADFLESMEQQQGPDMAALIVQSPEREKFLSFTAPYLSAPYVIFDHQQDDLIFDINGLAGKTVAVPRGVYVQKQLAKNFPGIELSLFDSDEKALKAVATGQADSYIGNLTVASHIIHKLGFSNLRVVAPGPFGDQFFSMGNRDDWPQLTSIIDKGLASITEEEKTAIHNKYVALKHESGISREDVAKWGLGATGLASGIILLILLWNRSLSKLVKVRTGALEAGKKSLETEILERKRVEEELLELKDQLHDENIYLREEIRRDHNFDQIIGNSEVLRYVLFRVEQIKATDTTVLILGETGTGKELIARAIHNSSPRKDRPFIKVNCATLSAQLIESELFGHEKGAFTGATVQRMGRFELADGATLFLDEIGELPLELQSKLLSVIQDGEFQRVGSSRSIKVDVRLIAATNRDLETEILSGRFRQDLFYRLNVYSLTLPPLRERRDDMPLLMDTFIKRYNKKLGKRIELISSKTKKALFAYSWPGNIRELKNVIEKAVIVSQGKALHVELPEIKTPVPTDEPTQTLDEMDRDYIQKVLNLKNWRIDGPKGAALVLDLKPSTLRYRMQKLGIKRPS